MLKYFMFALMLTTIVEAKPSDQTATEVQRHIPEDQRSRFNALFEKVCKVKESKDLHETLHDSDILALQTALAYKKTGPEIAQNIRQSAITTWNVQKASPVVKQAVLKLLTYGIRPNNGYAVHLFQTDFLIDQPVQDRVKLKKEFEQATTSFWPKITKQVEQEWLKQLPKFNDIDAAANAAGLDHQAALDIYTALLGHQIYGWIESGFGGDLNTFNKISLPSELNKESVKELYISLTERDAVKITQAFNRLPSNIGPEIVVTTAAAYTENLPATLNKINSFSRPSDRNLISLKERLFNSEILVDQHRFATLQLGDQFLDQIKMTTNNLGMVPIIESEEIVGFRRAHLPQLQALIHVAAIRNTPSSANAISLHHGLPISQIPAETILGYNSPDDPANVLAAIALNSPVSPTAEKATIKTVADLGKYITVVDNTILAQKYPRKSLFDLRHQLMLISFHPKAEQSNFDINPEFRSSLEKIFSGPTINELYIGLLEDHLHRIEQMCDRQIGYDTDILAHSAFYREKFVLEAFPGWSTNDSSKESYGEIQHFFNDARRVFRRLQQLEIEVLTESRDKATENDIAFENVLLRWETEGGLSKLKNSGSINRVQWNLLQREMKEHPELYGDTTAERLWKASSLSTKTWIKRIVSNYAPTLNVK